jgi:uncharacterized membrane protein
MSSLDYNTKILPKAQIACFAYRIDVFISYCINKFSQSLVELPYLAYIPNILLAWHKTQKKNMRIARVESWWWRKMIMQYLFTPLATVAIFLKRIFSSDSESEKE